MIPAGVAPTWNGRTPADVTDGGITYGRNVPFHEVEVMVPVLPYLSADPSAPEPPPLANPSEGRAWGAARHNINFYLDMQYSDAGIDAWPYAIYGKAPLLSPTADVAPGRQLPFLERTNIARPNYVSWGDVTDMASQPLPGM